MRRSIVLYAVLTSGSSGVVVKRGSELKFSRSSASAVEAVVQPQSCLADDDPETSGNNDKLLKALCPEDFDEEPPLMESSEARRWTGSMVRLHTCPIFYQTAFDYVGQGSVRRDNVEAAMAANKMIKNFNVVYWRRPHDWEHVVEAFAKLRLSVCYFEGHTCNKAPNKGQFSRWMTLIMALAYQKKMGLPCMIMLEDDVQLLNIKNVSGRLANISMPRDDPYILRFNYWGDGYVFNQAGIDEFLHVLYQRGAIGTMDWWINHNLQHIIEQVSAGTRQLIQTNAGDIYESSNLSAATFDYPASHDHKNFAPLLNAFSSAGDLDLSAALARFVKMPASAFPETAMGPNWETTPTKGQIQPPTKAEYPHPPPNKKRKRRPAGVAK